MSCGPRQNGDTPIGDALRVSHNWRGGSLFVRNHKVKRLNQVCACVHSGVLSRIVITLDFRLVQAEEQDRKAIPNCS